MIPHDMRRRSSFIRCLLAAVFVFFVCDVLSHQSIYLFIPVTYPRKLLWHLLNFIHCFIRRYYLFILTLREARRRRIWYFTRCVFFTYVCVWVMDLKLSNDCSIFGVEYYIVQRQRLDFWLWNSFLITWPGGEKLSCSKKCNLYKWKMLQWLPKM